MSSIEYINSVVLTASAANVTFSNIPQYYQDLIIEINGRSNRSGQTSDNIFIQFNSDSTATNYSVTRIYGNGTTTTSDRFSGASPGYGFLAGIFTGNSSTANEYSPVSINILSYSNSNIFKNWLWQTGPASVIIENGIGLWRNTTAINSILIKSFTDSSIASGSTFTLWGIR